MHQSIDKKNKVIIYLVFLFILSTTTGKLLEQKKKFSLKIYNIKVLGSTIVKNLEIQNELNSILYQNILFLGKSEINKIINKHNIIEEYNIKKIYPSTININIKQTKIVAKLSNNDELLVGSNGKIFEDKKNNEILPYIFGEFNSKEFLTFKKDIDQSKFIFAELKTLYFFPSNRWDILTYDDILIKLPKDDMLKSLNLAFKIINNNDFENKNLIDLRLNNHLIIK